MICSGTAGHPARPRRRLRLLHRRKVAAYLAAAQSGRPNCLPIARSEQDALARWSNYYAIKRSVIRVG